MVSIKEIRRQLAGAVLYTQRPLAGARAGQFRIRVRGSGSDLDQLRDYQPGDDVRFIDWKSSARIQHLVVRDYRDERSRTINLVCDLSRSMDFGSGKQRLRDCAAEVALSLAVLCENAGDACGLFLARDCLEQRLVPSVGAGQTARVASALATENVAEKAIGDLGGWCMALGARQVRSSVIFILSDFIGDFDEDFRKYALPLAQKHLLVAVRLLDQSEQCPQLVGRHWLLQDSEGTDGRSINLRLESALECDAAAKALNQWRIMQENTLRKVGFLVCDCCSSRPIVPQLCAELRRCGLFLGAKK